MRGLLVVALAAACVAVHGHFSHPAAQVYNSWNLDAPVKYAEDFAEVALKYGKIEEHANEHSRRKRNAERIQSTRALPITKSCERPGYTGQFCEFPICREENPVVDTNQWNTDSGFYVDMTLLANCTRVHTMLVDDTMTDLRIEIQSDKPNDPTFILTDAQGNVARPNKVSHTQYGYDARYNGLTVGVYSLIPSTLDESGHCVVIATSHTPLTISGGFASDDGRDRSDFPREHGTNHMFHSIILHANNLLSPGKLTTVEIIGPNNYHFRNRLLETRYGCAFENYFDSMFCYTNGSYALTVEGVDHLGNLYRRAFPFMCLNGPVVSTVAPPSTVSPASPTRCGHGGILLTRPDNSAYCMCQDRWTGVTCSVPICVNGGTPFHDEEGDECICPIGYHGLHCEEVHCNVDSEHGFGVDRPLLILVLRVRSQMNDVISQIRDAVNQTVTNLAFDQDYLARFQLVFFNNDKLHLNKYYTNYDDMMTQLNRASVSAHSDGGCTDTVFGSISSGLTGVGITSKSVMYVVTDGLADDHDEYLDKLYQMNSYWKATLNFIYVDPVDTNCTADVSDPGFRAFETLANRFNGLAWHISKRSDVYNIVFNHMDNLLYRTQLMLTVDRQECSHGLLKTIDVTRSNEAIIIVSHGQEFYPFLTDPNGGQVTAGLEELVNHHGYFGLWRLKNPLLGQYVLKGVTSPPSASCSFRVYQGAYKASGFNRAPELFWAISEDIDKDGTLPQPTTLIENHPVFHLTEMPPFENQDRIFVALSMYAVRDNTELEVYAANGIWRDQCSYNFFFPAFQCKRVGELLHFEFNIRDNFGFYLQRGGSMYCGDGNPTIIPPSACQNGGVATSNGTCLCQPHYTGDKCEKIFCEHGGSQLGNKCKCTAGWGGDFCDIPVCPTQGPTPDYGYYVDLAFVIEITQGGQAQINALSNVIQEVLRDVTTQHRQWIDRIVLVGYNGTWSDVLIDAPADSYGRVVDRVKQLASVTNKDPACVVRSWEALRRLLYERSFGSGFRGIPRRSVINLLQAGVPDQFDNGMEAETVSEELREKYVTLNVFQSNGNKNCNVRQTDLRLMEKAATRGDGRLYNLGDKDLQRALYMTPTLFTSSIAYKFHSDDCTVPQNVFFPVDAYTQTASAIVAGYQSSVSFFRYDGKAFDDKGRVDIFSNNWENVVEFRNPCQSGWEELQQNCMHFNGQVGPQTQQGAAAVCSDQGGFLVDVQSKDKNVWLKGALAGTAVWLGAVLDKGTWYFVHDNQTRSPITGASFTDWYNQTVPTDTKAPCAYFDPISRNGYWRASACDAKYITACQKHRFDQNNSPSKIGDDDLSPGKFFFAVNTKTPPANPDGTAQWKGCSVTVRLQSDLQVEYGFVDDLRKDMPMAVANIDSTSNRAVASISLGRSRSEASKMKHVMLRSDDANSTLLEASPEMFRRGCSFEYYSHKLSCQQTGGQDFQLVHIGEDVTGNTFQRYTTSFCTKWVALCVNGGVYSDGACVCPEYFTGDRCQSPICQNGGVLSGERRCSCPSGFTGEACQFPMCAVNSNATFTNDGKSLVFIVESSTATKEAIGKIADNLAAIVAVATASRPAWFNSYIVQSFKPDGKIDEAFMYGSVADAAAKLKDVANGATEDPKCQMPLYEALAKTFKFWSFLDGSEVLLISTSTPIDNDNANVFPAMEQFGTHSPFVDYIHVESDACPISDWTANLTNFGYFIHSTGGVLFRTKPADVVESMKAFLPSRYAPQRLTYTDHVNCNQANFYVQVDVNMTDLYIASSGNKATASVQGPKGEAVDLEELFKSDKVQSLWHVSPSYPGTYLVTLSASDVACFPSVWGSGGVQVIFGFVQEDNTLDNVTPYAVKGKHNYPVFHLVDPDNSRFVRGTLYYTNMVRRTISGRDDSPYKSDVSPRANCAYHHFGNAFLCSDEDETLTLSVSGMDTFRQPFTRQITTWCKDFSGPSTASTSPRPPTSPQSSTAAPPTSLPPTSVAPPVTTPSPVPSSTSVAPPPTTTTRPLTPKEIPFDIVFLVDETEDENFIDNTAIPFVQNVMSKFTVSQRNGRVGLITLPSTESRAIPVSFLSSCDSADALKQNLLTFDDFLDDNPSDVEYVTQALKFAHYQYNKTSNGYRPYISNHLMVMFTANTNFTDIDTAVKEASSIVGDNVFGMITVGYGGKINEDNLKKFAGPDCTYTAANSTALTGVVSKIQDRIWAAYNTTGGMYCGPLAGERQR